MGGRSSRSLELIRDERKYVVNANGFRSSWNGSSPIRSGESDGDALSRLHSEEARIWRETKRREDDARDDARRKEAARLESYRENRGFIDQNKDPNKILLHAWIVVMKILGQQSTEKWKVKWNQRDWAGRPVFVEKYSGRDMYATITDGWAATNEWDEQCINTSNNLCRQVTLFGAFLPPPPNSWCIYGFCAHCPSGRGTTAQEQENIGLAAISNGAIVSLTADQTSSIRHLLIPCWERQCVLVPGKNWVVALFDHVAEEEDELSFSVGDKVEVMKTDDGGWWKGRAHGKEGMFPFNYVKTL